MSAAAPGLPMAVVLPARLLRTSSRHSSNSCAGIGCQIQSRPLHGDSRPYGSRRPQVNSVDERSSRFFAKVSLDIQFADRMI